MRTACAGIKDRPFLLSLNFYKHIFGSAAHWANPVIREFVKRGVWGDIAVGIALFWIIDVTADFAFPLFHFYLPFRPSPRGGKACAVRLFKDFIIVDFFKGILVLALLLNQKGKKFS